MEPLDPIPGAYRRSPVAGPHDVVGYHKRNKFYSTQRWQRIRAGKLSRCPFCQLCSRLPDTVDHLDGNVTNNTSGNLVTLCNSCHGWKTNQFEKQITLCTMDVQGKDFVRMVKELPDTLMNCADFRGDTQCHDYDVASSLLHYHITDNFAPTIVYNLLINCSLSQREKWISHTHTRALVESNMERLGYSLTSVWHYTIVKQRFQHLLQEANTDVTAP